MHRLQMPHVPSSTKRPARSTRQLVNFSTSGRERAESARMAAMRAAAEAGDRPLATAALAVSASIVAVACKPVVARICQVLAVKLHVEAD